MAMWTMKKRGGRRAEKGERRKDGRTCEEGNAFLLTYINER